MQARLVVLSLFALIIAALVLPLAAPTVFADTNGVWSTISTSTSPGARSHSAAAYDRRGKRMLLFGGSVGTTKYNDVWELRLGCFPAWRQISTSSTTLPDARNDASAIYDPVRNHFVIYGGGDNVHAYGDTWVFNPADSSWIKLDARTDSCFHSSAKPCRRYDHTAIYNEAADRMWTFGGQSCGLPLSDAWVEQLTSASNTWQGFSGHTDCGEYYLSDACYPEIRSNQTEIYDSRNQDAVVLGGVYEGDGAGASNTWISVSHYCSEAQPPYTSLWTRVADLPGSGRSGHTAVYDSAGARMIVFGGADTPNDSTQALALPAGGGTPSWSTLHPQGTPPAASTKDHVAIFDPDGDRMILYDNSGNTWQLLFDTTPPATTTDLNVASITGGVKFKWTAPGNDGTSGGNAGSYTVRERAGSEITESNWSSCTVVTGASGPSTPGTRDSITIGLSSGVYWYVALKTCDGAGNISGLSNNACIKLGNPPDYCDGGLSATPAREESRPALDLAIVSLRPNPAVEGVAEVSFTLAEQSPATLRVFDIAGRLVESHDLARFGPGAHEISIGGSSKLPAGHYRVRISQGGRSVTRSVIVVR